MRQQISQSERRVNQLQSTLERSVHLRGVQIDKNTNDRFLALNNQILRNVIELDCPRSVQLIKATKMIGVLTPTDLDKRKIEKLERDIKRAEERYDKAQQWSINHICQISENILGQQIKAKACKRANGIRWNPAIIRWCLYLHHKSSGAYSTLRDSGLISLPSERTLTDYRHFASPTTGFSKDTDMQL